MICIKYKVLKWNRKCLCLVQLKPVVFLYRYSEDSIIKADVEEKILLENSLNTMSVGDGAGGTKFVGW